LALINAPKVASNVLPHTVQIATAGIRPRFLTILRARFAMDDHCLLLLAFTVKILIAQSGSNTSQFNHIAGLEFLLGTLDKATNVIHVEKIKVSSSM
jgi:hypothetical protein